MQISVIAIGRLKDAAERRLADRYIERFRGHGRALGFFGIGETELAESRLQSADARKVAEAKQLLGKVPERARIVALDERGRQLTSEEFAATLARWRDDGVAATAFLIGGPDGHGEPVKARADLKLSLGAMTFPHGIVRVLLAEQLYRAATILAGHPYHRS